MSAKQNEVSDEEEKNDRLNGDCPECAYKPITQFIKHIEDCCEITNTCFFQLIEYKLKKNVFSLQNFNQLIMMIN